MKPKVIVKISVDVLMTLALLFLMGYHLWGETLHEWVGVGMFILFIVHHILNGNWHKAIFKGRYTPMRIIMLCINLLLFITMLIQFYSGVVMSRTVFSFMPSIGGMALARILHILGAYWGFILMSLHLGLHWNMILGMLKKVTGIKNMAKNGRTIIFVIGFAIAAYGIWVFFDRNFPTYLLLKTDFVFLDYNESKLLFYVDYLALMGVWIFAAHYGTKIVQKFKK